MANYIDYTYMGKVSDPTGVMVWEQNYDTGAIEEKVYNIKDYLYFYVDSPNDSETLEGMTSQRGTDIKQVREEDFKSYKAGDKAKDLNDLGFNTYESDIPPLQKVMLDHYGKDNMKAPKWNLALYDIETDVKTEDSFMKMRDEATSIINAISVWYAKPNKFFEFAVVPPILQDEWDYDTIETRGNSEIRYYDSEKEMLLAFFEMNMKYETVALGAWNGDFFDTKYIYDRCIAIWKKPKIVANLMGRFDSVTKQKIQRGDKEEILIRPKGLIWYDCLEAYKKNGPELESFALEAVAEEELDQHKLSFEGDFEALYHGFRKDRDRFHEITPARKKKALLATSREIGQTLVDELHDHFVAKAAKDKNIIDAERETRTQMMITDYLSELLKDEETIEELGDNLVDFERFVLYKKFKDTFDLFLDYSIQDTQLLFDLEMKLTKFNTLSMLAQYNVSSFHDVFSTLKQVEQGITNFAHLNNKKVVIDREYDKAKQLYNQHIDPELLRIRTMNDYRIMPEDCDEIREMKTLTSQPKIPGAHVLSPNIGLISFDEEVTPDMAREFKTLRAELNEIDKQLEAFEE